MASKRRPCPFRQPTRRPPADLKTGRFEGTHAPGNPGRRLQRSPCGIPPNSLCRDRPSSEPWPCRRLEIATVPSASGRSAKETASRAEENLMGRFGWRGGSDPRPPCSIKFMPQDKPIAAEVSSRAAEELRPSSLQPASATTPRKTPSKSASLFTVPSSTKRARRKPRAQSPSPRIAKRTTGLSVTMSARPAMPEKTPTLAEPARLNMRVHVVLIEEQEGRSNAPAWINSAFIDHEQASSAMCRRGAREQRDADGNACRGAACVYKRRTR